MNGRHVPAGHRLVLVDPDDISRSVLQRRLRAQGYPVFSTASPAEAATDALADPPSAVIARLWMPSISGVQLCHLLKSEAATTDVPVVLLGDGFAPRGRFWAEQAGASYVQAGAVGELLRVIARSIEERPPGEAFFTMLGAVDLRDRIGRLLDRRLFDSLLAAEVRSLAGCESFERLFDQLSQLMCRLVPYSWLALSTESGDHMGLHARPDDPQETLRVAQATLAQPEGETLLVLDEDAWPRAVDERISSAVVRFGGQEIGRLAVGAPARERDVPPLVELVAQELGGPLRVALLMETTRRLSMYDPLTSAMNRRAFIEHMASAEAPEVPSALCLIDVDHFKQINDRYGHSTGDLVLKHLGKLLNEQMRALGGATCRWGGEEFVLAFPARVPGQDAEIAERLRTDVASLALPLPEGEFLRLTVSIGLTTRAPDEPLDAVVMRADAAMYRAKLSGRNRVELA